MASITQNPVFIGKAHIFHAGIASDYPERVAENSFGAGFIGLVGEKDLHFGPGTLDVPI